MIYVVCSGFFDPIGRQHLKLFEEAKKLGDYLIVGINSDKCSEKKKGQPAFMPYNDRVIICENLKMVDEVVGFEDNDGTACQLIVDVYEKYKVNIDSGIDSIIFCNGGDRKAGISTPEDKYVKENLNNKVSLAYGVGGDYKLASSSEYLKNWINNTMKRYNVNFKLESKY